MDRTKDLETIIVIALGLGALSYFLQLDVLIPISFGVLLIAVLSKRLAALISKGWMGIGMLMGTVMTKLILSITFYLFLTPIAFLYRLFNKDSMKLKKTERESMFDDRDHKYEGKDLEKPW